eukprot:Phypoly_transcript_21944.p1 GENE.Phypoly_transcript_21944~~Phypoly_transcript_21944.p1  ORF type:complete len:165 (+),score=56.11 Phypoly_transcript_21944:24-497(+)
MDSAPSSPAPLRASSPSPALPSSPSPLRVASPIPLRATSPIPLSSVPPPKPPRDRDVKEEEEQKRKSLPPVPKSFTTIKFICVNHDKKMVELPKSNPTRAQLKERLQQKLGLLPGGSFVISRHHGGKAINSQADLDDYLEECKDVLHLGVEIDVIQF